ncbi:hypothetical protein ACJIZ3_024356 [Penstemon smallii]|uniref:RRM domain-containing protein n=1 Tax=Penstemon smallii TaxID=265156 RepID=A0ABD3TRT7_9LAMI
MDLIKKRKADENGAAYTVPAHFNNTAPTCILYPEDVEKILEPFTEEQLLPILRAAVLRHLDVLEAVRAVADADPVQRKLFVRGLGWETTTEKLRQVFSVYGELDEANTVVVTDKNNGNPKGYGFVTFKHIDSAILSLKEPNKKIDGRITVTQLAAAGNSGTFADVALRKIYVGNIPFEISAERLLAYFSVYGEIEEGPVGFDKQSGRARGFAFFVYKTEDGAKEALVEPMKIIDGNQVVCKLADDNKKQKPNVGPTPGGMVPGMANSGYSQGMQAPSIVGYMAYAPVRNVPPPPPQQPGMVHQNAGYDTSMVGPVFGGGYGPYGSAGSQYGGTVGTAGPGEYGSGLNGAGGYIMQSNTVGVQSSGGYIMPPSTVGVQSSGGYIMPPSTVGVQFSGGYAESGNYGLQPAYQSQQSQPAAGPGPRFPAYQGMPPYY